MASIIDTWSTWSTSTWSTTTSTTSDWIISWEDRSVQLPKAPVHEPDETFDFEEV